MAFTMGKDLLNIVQNPIGQPFATIVLGALGKQGTLALWTFVVISQFIMAHSRFAADVCFQPRRYLYYISPSQGIPSRCVWCSLGAAVLLGLIPLAGPAASSGIFALPVIGQYTCNATVICARWLGPSKFKPGPFYLGIMSLPVSVVAVIFMVFMAVILCFPSEPVVTPDTMNYAALVFGGVVLLATFYYFCPGIGGRNWFAGPAVTIEWEGKEASETKEERVSQEK
ncbi:hypothetical protein PQX77_012958 [Marasmius sp. AFHP31]|nr:hypothetical protein PQX77_012958 [Marasmius sp. AFHP31]